MIVKLYVLKGEPTLVWMIIKILKRQHHKNVPYLFEKVYVVKSIIQTRKNLVETTTLKKKNP